MKKDKKKCPAKGQGKTKNQFDYEGAANEIVSVIARRGINSNAIPFVFEYVKIKIFGLSERKL